jgi:hypothetical protein
MSVEHLSREAEIRTVEDLVNSLSLGQITLLEKLVWLPEESPLHHHLKVVLYNRSQLLRGASV